MGPRINHVGRDTAAGILVVLATLFTGCKQLSDPSRTSATTPTTTAPRQVEKPSLPDPKRYGGPANFVTNPSFEKSVTPWVPWSKNSLVQRTSSVHRDGHAAVRVGALAAAPYGIQLSDVVGFPARGDAFRLSTWMRSADRRKKVELILTAYGSRSRAQTVATHVAVVGTRWTRVIARGRIRGANFDSLTVSIVVLRSIGAADAFFLDRVSVTPGF